MTLKITAGGTAEGKEKYFPRPAITKRIWRKIKRGEHLLVTAPRRVGKSSLLKHMTNNPEDGYIVKYSIVQSVDRENEFYKLLYNEFIEDPVIFNKISRYWKQASTAVKDYLNKISEIGTSKVSFDKTQKLDYKLELTHLLCSIDDDCPKVVMIVDEFPHALENILADGHTKGIRFLQSIREIRQNSKISQKVQFIFTGSIGLENVVKKIGQSNLVNDFAHIEVPPLTIEEAGQLIDRLIQGLSEYDDISLSLPEEAKTHLIEKVEWRIPYFFQAIIDELSEIHEDGGVISCKAVDEALARIVRNRYKYDNYFEHWKSRLRVAFDQGGQYHFAMDILNRLAAGEPVDKAVFSDLAVKHQVEDPNYIQSVLEYDGYVNEHEGIFRFNSPILKTWWFINVAT